MLTNDLVSKFDHQVALCCQSLSSIQPSISLDHALGFLASTCPRVGPVFTVRVYLTTARRDGAERPERKTNRRTLPVHQGVGAT